MRKFICLSSCLLILAGCSGTAETEKSVESTVDTSAEAARRKIIDEANARVEASQSRERAEEEAASKEKEYLESEISFGLNEEAVITDSSKNPAYSVKIIKATTALSQSGDFYTNGKPDNTVEITYEYKNYNIDEAMDVAVQFFAAYDSDGLAGETQSIQDGQNEISKGKSARSTIWIVMDKSMLETNEIEIDYSNDFTLDFNGTATFKVPLEH